MENPHLLEESVPKCAICNDEGLEWNPEHTRCRPCRCRLEARAQSVIRRTVPEIYASAPRIMEVKPFKRLVSSQIIQETIIHQLASNPLDSYFFIGPTGSGKTYLMYALYKEALYAGRKARFVSCRDFVEMLRKDEMRRPEAPIDPQIITRDDLTRSYFGPFHLFIDEWGKAPDSEYTYNQLFGIVDYCHNYPSQVVLCVSTNLTKEEFKDTYGAALTRRLLEICSEVYYGE